MEPTDRKRKSGAKPEPQVLKPSEVTEEYWVGARRKNGEYPPDTERSGKWMVFVPWERHDAVWDQIRQATEDGLLGSASKAATARPNALRTDDDHGAIMVYTYDGDDVEDVNRVRAALRALGHTQALYWKPNQATRDGIYSEGGRRRVWRYRD